MARYTIGRRGQALSAIEQRELLTTFRDAPPIAYRKTEPISDDFDTYIIAPEAGTRRGESYLTWQVCKNISFRRVRKPDRNSQKVEVGFEDTDDCELARVVALPRLGVLAVEDGAGDGRMGGWSAVKRFESIVKQHSDADFGSEPAGSPQDLKRAIETWDLDRFSFQARPFNPHPSSPGILLSDLLKTDGVGQLRATVTPIEGQHMKPKQDGIIQEAMGLAEQGYATYGATARTPSGAEAVVKKQDFSFDRSKNLDRLRGPQQLRVYIEYESEDQEIHKIVDVLVEFFAPDVKLPG